jgi:hypothetical protein
MRYSKTPEKWLNHSLTCHYNPILGKTLCTWCNFWQIGLLLALINNFEGPGISWGSQCRAALIEHNGHKILTWRVDISANQMRKAGVIKHGHK